VHVPRRAEGRAEAGVRLIALGGPGGIGREAYGRAEGEEHPALVELAAAPQGGADEHVREAIAVDVTRGCDGAAELRRCLIALGGPGRRGDERIDREGILGGAIVHFERERLSLELEAGGELATAGVPGAEPGVVEDRRVAGGERDGGGVAVFDDRLRVGGAGECAGDPERARASRLLGDREALFETRWAILVPLDEPRVEIGDPRAVRLGC